MTDADLSETALIVIPEPDIMSAFTGEFSNYFEPRLAKLKARVGDFMRTPRNASNQADREEIEAFARKLMRTRTSIEAHGKALADKLKALPKRNDENRRRVRIEIEGLEAEVMEPVEAWEVRERARKREHIDAIDRLKLLGRPATEMGVPFNAAALRVALARVESEFVVGPACEEFEEEYRIARASAMESLRTALAARERYEADQAELAALRAQQAERDAKEAAQREEREANERFEAFERERVHREQRAEVEAAERAKREAEQREQAAIAAAARAELQARLDAQAAETRWLEAEAEARRREDAKIAADRAEAEKRRERNKAHRARVNNEIVAALLKTMPMYDSSAEAHDLRTARAIVTAIAKGDIPHCKIEY